jgi:predicted nucleic acid-binding protein
MILLDTNVLARMTDSGNPHCALARRAVQVLLGQGERLKSYDARLVTAMQGYGITQLLTFNADDFKRFPVTVIDPPSL